MATSSIHIASGKAGYLSHNDRSLKTNNSIFFDEKNEVSLGNKEAFKIYRNELKKRSLAYSKRTKQSIQKKSITHLSAIVNLNQHHTLEDMQPLIDHLETSLDTKIFQVAIHRDEGHIKDGENIKNYHAHIEFMGIDSKGSSIRRKLTKQYLKDLQTETANILGMERGKKNSKAKRLDTYEFKKHKEKEEQTLKPILATQKDLKKEIANLREQLKESNAVRSDYAQLEQINRELKEQLKSKELTELELKAEMQQLKEKLLNPVKVEVINRELEKRVEELEELVYHPTMTYTNTSNKVTFKDASSHFKNLFEQSKLKIEELENQPAKVVEVVKEVKVIKEVEVAKETPLIEQIRMKDTHLFSSLRTKISYSNVSNYDNFPSFLHQKQKDVFKKKMTSGEVSKFVFIVISEPDTKSNTILVCGLNSYYEYTHLSFLSGQNKSKFDINEILNTIENTQIIGSDGVFEIVKDEMSMMEANMILATDDITNESTIVKANELSFEDVLDNLNSISKDDDYSELFNQILR